LSFVLGVGAPSLSLVGFIFVIDIEAVRRGSFVIVILMVRCCFGDLCVRDRLAACLRMLHFCCFR